MTLLIRGGRVIDPAGSIDAVQDVLIEHDKIARIGSRLTTSRASTSQSTKRSRAAGAVATHRMALRSSGGMVPKSTSHSLHASFHAMTSPRPSPAYAGCGSSERTSSRIAASASSVTG